MASYKAYNRMMVSPLVFNALAGYTHMIVHEPDAVVIRDEIDYWCNQPFDYIGAPALEGWGQADAPVIRFGNFGFSFHTLSTSRRIINSSLRWEPFYTAVVENLIRGTRGDKARLRQGLIRLGSAGRLRGLISSLMDIAMDFGVLSYQILTKRSEYLPQTSQFILPGTRCPRAIWSCVEEGCLLAYTRGSNGTSHF
jgi:hypothetical protein